MRSYAYFFNETTEDYWNKFMVNFGFYTERATYLRKGPKKYKIFHFKLQIYRWDIISMELALKEYK